MIYEDRYKPNRLDFFPRTARGYRRGEGDSSSLKQWCEERGLNVTHPITSMMRATGIPKHIEVD